MTSRPLSTGKRTDEQPTVAVHRRSTLATELLVLATSLAVALATAWVVTQPLLGLATLAGLALLAVALRVAPTPWPRPTPLATLTRR